MSAYANIARAWGAEVRGWDLRETIFSETLEGIELDLGGEPRPPEGFEVIVSTGHRERIEGIPRATFLAELVASRPSIVVTGAHGKTTTTAMIAYALRETGNDPAWIVGGVVPQLGGNAGGGSGWLVVEGDESDRSAFALQPRLAVVTNVELDHHAAYGSEAELRAAIDGWLEDVPDAVLGWELEPATFPLAVPGEHNRWNAAAALEALVRAGVAREERDRGARHVHGRRTPLRARRRAWRRTGDRRLRAQPDRAQSGARDGAVADRRAAVRGVRPARRRAHAAPASRAR